MSTSIDDITTTVRDLAAKELGRSPEDLDVEANLRDMEGVDSVKTLRVVATVERRYDVELEDKEIFAISSISDLARLVAEAVHSVR